MRKDSGLWLQTSVVQDNVPVEIAAGLYVGSIHAAYNIEMLKSRNISHVLNLAGSYAAFPEDFTYLSLSIRDKEYANLLSCLPVAAIFIDAGLKHGGVLIHCVGGRSRSPAMAMAFLMMKQQKSYLTVSAHVKALRPVVNLNAGFDAQLKFLDKARGDVFVANQQHLKTRLASLAQRYKDGEYVHEVASDRRQSQHEVASDRRQSQQVSNQSPTPPLFEKQSSIKMLASGCNVRGMLGERVPGGFCLSLPSGGYSMAKADNTAASSFIPALRSMGTTFGCQCCGESLFCAGAIIHHDDIAILRNEADESPTEGNCMHFLEALRGYRVSNFVGKATSGNAVGEEQVVMTNTTTNPLLAKPPLRPHSPSKETMGNGSRTGSITDILSNWQVRVSPPVQAKPTNDSEGLQRRKEEFGQPLQVLQVACCLTWEQNQCSSSATPSPNQVNGECGLWHSLAYPNNSKCVANDNKRTLGKLQKNRELQKLDEWQTKVFNVSQNFEPVVSFKRNTVEWHRSIQQLVRISKHSSRGSTVEQVAALLDEDSTVLAGFNGCKQWFIDPQSWMIAQASLRPEGEIHCPKETCRAIVGEWQWQGSRYAREGCIAPAFIMKKDAVCVLGNMTSQPTELMGADRESHPEE